MAREGIALAGSLILDYYKEIDIYPEHSTLATIQKVSRETGGLVCNCVQALNRIDSSISLSVIGRIGDDEAGQFIQDRLLACDNMNLDNLIVEGSTSFTDAMIDLKNTTRTYFQYRGANADLDVSDFNLDQLNAKILHVGYILLLDKLDAPDPEYGTVMARLLRNAQSRGIRTSIDVVSEVSDRFATIVPAALKYTDYAIMNEYEASKTTGIPVRDLDANFLPDNALQICRELLGMGVTTWVVIHSREGAVGVSASGETVKAPSLQFNHHKIISTIGAGDAFLSGCLQQAYLGNSLEQAIKVGLASATTSLRRFNATDGILPERQLAQFYEQTPKESWPGF